MWREKRVANFTKEREREREREREGSYQVEKEYLVVWLLVSRQKRMNSEDSSNKGKNECVGPQTLVFFFLKYTHTQKCHCIHFSENENGKNMYSFFVSKLTFFDTEKEN